MSKTTYILWPVLIQQTPPNNFFAENQGARFPKSVFWTVWPGLVLFSQRIIPTLAPWAPNVSTRPCDLFLCPCPVLPNSVRSMYSMPPALYYPAYVSCMTPRAPYHMPLNDPSYPAPLNGPMYPAPHDLTQRLTALLRRAPRRSIWLHGRLQRVLLRGRHFAASRQWHQFYGTRDAPLSGASRRHQRGTWRCRRQYPRLA